MYLRDDREEQSPQIYKGGGGALEAELQGRGHEAEEDEADGGEQDEGLRGDEPEDAVAVFQPAGGGREAAP